MSFSWYLKHETPLPTMPQNGSSLSTRGRTLRRLSLVEGYNLYLLATIIDEMPLYQSKAENRKVFDKPEKCYEQDSETLSQRSRLLIRTAQGVKFESPQSLEYKKRLENLVLLATSPNTSPSNALLAQKALKYRHKSKRNWFCTIKMQINVRDRYLLRLFVW